MIFYLMGFLGGSIFTGVLVWVFVKRYYERKAAKKIFTKSLVIGAVVAAAAFLLISKFSKK